MAIWKCKFCGAPLDVPESGTVASCEYCGIRQTVPKLDDDRRNLLLDRAGQFLRSNEYDRAAALYEQAITEGGDDPELYWSLVLCRYGIEYVEDPASRRRIPTVNRTQYIAVSADPDYREAIARADSAQRELYEREAAEIDSIQRGILEISQKEEPFDVFICYKETDANGRRTPDSVLAQELYYGLKNEGFKVFFSRISLEDKLGTAYEPYIFSALHSAKVMVAIGTKPDYFNAVWVRNEWSRYLALIKQGEKKVLIPAYRDMDPYNLPDEFAALQALDMGKLGFMQDLIRGIKKIIGRTAQKVERTTTPIAAPVSTPTVNSTSKNNMLERGFLALEDREWEKADGIFEQVLNFDLHEARAYFGKLLASRKLATTDALTESTEPIDDDKNFEKALRFANEEYREKLKVIAETIRQNVLEIKYKEAVAIPLDSLSGCYQAETLFRELGDYRDAAEKADFCVQERERIEITLKEEARTQTFNVRILRLYSILAMFFSLLLGILFAIRIHPFTIPLWLILSGITLIGGIAVCFALDVQKIISQLIVVAFLPAALILSETVAYSSSNGDLFATTIVALILFMLNFVITYSGTKNESSILIVSDGTRQIRLKQYMNCCFSSVIIPASVIRIKDYAFSGCNNLSVIIFQGTKGEWNEIKKGTGWISGTDSFRVQCTNGQLVYNKK
ncbi:MAG: TIR domain-containing protein [Clostridia bacterium]|nr:TIR domain-containing protein [Clostridia bacterium]